MGVFPRSETRGHGSAQSDGGLGRVFTNETELDRDMRVLGEARGEEHD